MVGAYVIGATHPCFYAKEPWLSLLQEREMLLMHWDVAKLLSLGVDENFLKTASLKPEQTRDLVKGLLYLRERFKDEAK